MIDPADAPSAVSARPVVVCDDMAACDSTAAFYPDVPADLMSFSPAAGPLGRALCGMADATATSEDLAGVFQLSLDLAEAIHHEIAAGGDPDAQDRAAACAAAAVQFQPALYVALCLARIAADRPTTFVVVDHGDAMLNHRFNGLAAELVKRLPGVTVATAPSARKIVQPAPPSARVLDRVFFNPWQSHAYRLEKTLSDRFGFRGRKGTLLIHRENELLKESAYYLARRGYAVRSMPPANKNGDATATPRRDLAGLIEARLGPLFSGDAAKAIAPFLAAKIQAAEQDYAGARARFAAALRGAASGNPRAVLSSLIMPVHGAALHAACASEGMPLIMFQHGVTPEICEPVSRLLPNIESAASDLVCCFNQAAADLSNRSSYRVGHSVSVGMPRELRDSVGKGTHTDGPPIWYVSTGLYRGRNALLHLAEPDHKIAEFEARMIDRVLSRLPHKVMYKPYPSVRYADGDPIIERARQSAGLTVYEKRGDFRFLAAQSRVIVTARAASTLSWCIMSGRPVVFIDIPTQSPLLPEARRAAEKALFLFDASAADFEQELHSFLSKPIEDIERMWRARAEDRSDFIERFLDTNRGVAGRVAADAVEQSIAEYAA